MCLEVSHVVTYFLGTQTEASHVTLLSFRLILRCESQYVGCRVALRIEMTCAWGWKVGPSMLCPPLPSPLPPPNPLHTGPVCGSCSNVWSLTV